MEIRFDKWGRIYSKDPADPPEIPKNWQGLKSQIPARLVQRKARDDGYVAKPLAKRRPRKCPDCRGSRVVPIRYGYPGPDMIEQMRAGKIVIGGCVVNIGGDPAWECLDFGE